MELSLWNCVMLYGSEYAVCGIKTKPTEVAPPLCNQIAGMMAECRDIAKTNSVLLY